MNVQRQQQQQQQQLTNWNATFQNKEIEKQKFDSQNKLFFDIEIFVIAKQPENKCKNQTALDL